MTPRERLITALANGKPDRLPTQVHTWTDYYLNRYLDGCDQYEAHRRFGIDCVAFIMPEFVYSDRSLAHWQARRTELGLDENGNRCWAETFTTPSKRW